MKGLFRRPSPATVVAMVALFAALGGTAVGAKVLSKKKVENIANRQITKRAPGLSVGGARTANVAETATVAATAGFAETAGLADNASDAQPTAFAQVNPAGGLHVAKNVFLLAKVGDSFYCFSGLPFTPKGLMAELDYNRRLQSGSTRAGLGDAFGVCPSGTQAFVATFDSANSPAPEGFFVLFYG